MKILSSIIAIYSKERNSALGILQANKEGRKFDWRLKIEALGFSFASKSRKKKM